MIGFLILDSRFSISELTDSSGIDACVSF